MRKNLLKMFGLVAFLAVALTGCATVSNITNDNKELIFNGGTVAQVGDYLYYSNAYTPLSGATTEYAYSANAKLSFLNRADLVSGFGLKSESPVKTEKVNSKVLGFENSYLFVLGDYVYFSAPNEHQTKHPIEHAYNLVTLWRSKLNGDGLKELYTTEQYNSNTAQMRVLKGNDGNYYWLVYDGTDITSIKLGASIGKKQVLAEDVKSVAMPRENDSYDVRSIFYTKAQNEGSNNVYAYALDYASGKSLKVTDNANDLNFVDRIGDSIFYTTAGTTYMQTLTSDEGIVFSASEQYEFYTSANAKNIYVVYNGFVFNAGSENKLFYKSSDNIGDPIEILAADEYTEILYVNGDWVYYSSGNDIKRLSVHGVHSPENIQSQTVVSMSSEITGKASVAGEYLYFYAGLEPVDEDDDKTYEETSNNYLYRVRLGENENFQILSYFTRTEVKN